jgi:hypothetical protein
VARPFAKRKQQQKKKTGFLLPLATSEAGKKNSSSLPKTRVLLFVAMNALPCISSLAAIEAMVVQQIQESPEHHVLVFLDIDETIFESALLVDCAAVANRAAFMAFYKLIEDLAGVKTRSEADARFTRILRTKRTVEPETRAILERLGNMAGVRLVRGNTR